VRLKPLLAKVLRTRIGDRVFAPEVEHAITILTLQSHSIDKAQPIGEMIASELNTPKRVVFLPWSGCRRVA
jgi:hypothetical protein